MDLANNRQSISQAKKKKKKKKKISSRSERPATRVQAWLELGGSSTNDVARARDRTLIGVGFEATESLLFHEQGRAAAGQLVRSLCSQQNGQEEAIVSHLL
jgi:hypothetical protein